MNVKKISFAAAFLAVASSAHTATIVYEDTFDGDGLATNTKTGGGLAQRTISTATFDDTGDLVDTAGADGGTRGVISSINSFSLTNGFTLEVHMNGGTTAILQSFGLSTSQFATDTNGEDWMTDTVWAGQNVNHRRYGIGVETGSTVITSNDRGLKFSDGAGTVTGLATTNSNLLPAGLNTFVLTVTPDDQFSYSYNGGAAVTGDIDPGGSFDLSNPLYFNIFSQSDINVSYVKITAIPEPSSTALLGLGGLALILRRRK